MQLRAPAKINLSFRIQHRRDDGFHEIETLMAPISLDDELTIERGDAGGGIQFECDDPALGGSDNLVVRAAKLFCETINAPSDLRIGLRKRIPHGAGLGGGSSDAATTLLGLNELFAADLSRERLTTLAAQLGSDVPFFILQSAAHCRGRGEIVNGTTLPAKLSLLLLKPRFGVATPWAYSHWRDSRELPGISYAAQTVSGIEIVNDLERPVFEKFVFLAQMKSWLLRQREVEAALLSGSGSTIFAVLRKRSEAAALIDRARSDLDPDLWAHACKTV